MSKTFIELIYSSKKMPNALWSPYFMTAISCLSKSEKKQMLPSNLQFNKNIIFAELLARVYFHLDNIFFLASVCSTMTHK